MLKFPIKINIKILHYQMKSLLYRLHLIIWKRKLEKKSAILGRKYYKTIKGLILISVISVPDMLIFIRFSPRSGCESCFLELASVHSQVVNNFKLIRRTSVLTHQYKDISMITLFRCCKKYQEVCVSDWAKMAQVQLWSDWRAEDV